MREILLTPGPVPVPADVLHALSQPMEHHRTPQFEKTLARALQNLKFVFGTEQPVFVHTATGSGAMESALVNTLSPGDEVIAIVSGKFGERWAEIAETYGIHVHRLDVPWGQSVAVAQVQDFLRKYPQSKAVLTQACETSTGAWHPLQELGALLKNTPVLLMVDAITALGAAPLPMDTWGLDVLIGGSQKAFMLPTGLSFISFSKKAEPHTQTARLPRYYFDIRKERQANARGETFFSTAVSLIRALDVVLANFQRVGLPAVYNRIEALAAATRAGAQELGLTLFPQVSSPSLTCLAMPPQVAATKVRKELEEKYGVTVMAGQDQLKDKVIRMGHMGAITDEDVLNTLDFLAQVLGLPEKSAAAQAAARSHLQKAPKVFA